MRTLAVLPQDGFYGDKEFIDFIKAMNDDLIEVLSSLIGTSTAFIKGGVVTVVGPDVTITSGIILKDSKLYHFTGGTFAGTTSTLKILFTESLASGFPQSYFDGDPVAKDIYLSRTAIIDAAGAITLDTVLNTKDLQWLKTKADLVDGKAGKNAFTVVTGTTAAAGFTVVLSSLSVKEYEDGTIKVYCALSFSGTKTKGTQILTSLPNSGDLNRVIPVFITDNATGESVGHAILNGNTLVVFSGFTSPNNAVWISFSYKKA